jgi:hypothetical protein
LTPTATISGLTAGQSYVLLRFDSVDALPARGGFLNAGWSAQYAFTASGATHVLSALDSIMSDGTYFYRCVHT